MFVYIVQAGEGGPVKIGTSKNPTLRVAKMQTDCPHPLRVVSLIEGDREDELALHRRFSSARISGEWFAVSPELKEYMGTLRAFVLSPGPRKCAKRSGHPLWEWLVANQRTVEWLCSQVQQGGKRLRPHYCGQILNGWCRPSWDLSRQIEKTTLGGVTWRMLMDRETRRPRTGGRRTR